MFHEDKIVLQFAAVSDLQHGFQPGVIDLFDTGERGRECFRQLQETALKYTDRGLDAVLFAGDLVHNAMASQVEGFKEIYEAVFDPAKVPFIFCLGNHDVKSVKTQTKQELNMDVFYRIFGKDYRTYDAENTDLQEGFVHQVVGGYHFLTVDPLDSGYLCQAGDESGAKYSPAAKQWLDRMLSRITAENPGQYVFFATHPMPYGLAYGGDFVYANIYWYQKELLPILNKYPQVIAFGGHLHFPIHDERSIMQDRITGVNCGSICYMGIENGGYCDMVRKTIMRDAAQVYNGHLVQVDADGNVRLLRMDFGLKKTIKSPWVLDAPDPSGAHLTRYTKARGALGNNQPPVLAQDAVTVDASSLTLTFRSGTDDDMIHHYVVRVTENGEEVETIKVLADFYLHADPAEMKPVWTLPLREDTYLKGHRYTVTLTAIDSWGLESNTATCEFTP